MATDEVVAAARLRLLLDERLGRETPHEVIRLAGGEAPDQLTVVVDLAEFEESAQAALRGYAEQGLVSWLLRIGLEAAGEEAVREVGRLLLAECGPADLLSRLGATEFVALVSRNPKDGVGIDVAERMRRVVAEHPWVTPVRINIGVAAAPPDQPLSAASSRARGALAVAAAGGGNRVAAAERQNRPGTPPQGEGWSIPSRRKRP
jgi:hypothetical protein